MHLKGIEFISAGVLFSVLLRPGLHRTELSCDHVGGGQDHFLDMFFTLTLISDNPFVFASFQTCQCHVTDNGEVKVVRMARLPLTYESPQLPSFTHN